MSFTILFNYDSSFRPRTCFFIRSIICSIMGCNVIIIYTVRSKSFRTDFLKNQRHMRKTHTIFLIQNNLHWHIYRPLRGRTVSEKLPKIPLFVFCLIHRLLLLGSQQHPQRGVLLTSFSTWGTENSLAEINLESTEDDKGL